MIPQPITIEGRTGTVVYLDNKWHPVTSEQAVMARVLYDDGGSAFFTVQSSATVEKPEGLGGITRKFDPTLHPRGDDGRFIEATQPRIFNKPSEVGQVDGWPGEPVRFGWKDSETGKVTGRLLTGVPIPPEEMRASLYHVTTNAPAVEESGVLLGLLESGGLGGGQAPGVSFTSSKEDAMVIMRELRRAVLIARGDVTIDAIEEWARNDELIGGLPEGGLKDAVAFARQTWDGNKFSLDKTFVWDKDLPEDKRGWVGPPPPPEEQERLRRSLLKDAFNSYLQIRGHSDVPLLKNPLLLGDQTKLAKLKPSDVQILDVPSYLIPEGALVTTGSDKFLHEVRAYSDVPILPKKKKAAREYVRQPAGTEHGGEFAKTQQGARAVLMGVMDGPVGVDDHPVAIRAAHETAAVLREMKAKGYEMPHEVEVRVQLSNLSGEADNKTLIVRVPDNLPPEISLDQAYETTFTGKIAVVENGEVLGEIRKFAGSKFRDLVIHEMGHILRRPSDYRETERAAKNFAKEMKAVKVFEHAARTTVSNYAGTNPDEFVAEVFSMLYNGEPIPPATRQIYDDMRGAKVL